jgi:hypothetical protein
VLNKIADEKTESFLRQQLALQHIAPIGAIHDHSTIKGAWLTGSEIRDWNKDSGVRAMVQRLDETAKHSTMAV